MGLKKTRTSPWPSRIAGLLLLAVVIQLGWVAGTLGSRLLAPPVAIPSIYGGNERQPGGWAEPVSVSVSELNLFGQSEGSAEVPEAISRNAPETKLRLQLNGVALAQQPEHSSAIVSGGPDSAVQWYRVGEMLPGNARLAEVQQDRILLRREGRIETLRFPDGGESTLAAVAPEASAPQTKEEFVAEAENRLAEDPTGALSSVGFSPRTEGPGYVYNGSNPMMNAMSLKQGDVVLAINGHQLGDLGSDQELMRQWSQQGELNIELERNGRSFSMTVPIP